MNDFTHTPGPWLIIRSKAASKRGRVHISNTRALQWCSSPHYVGRVTECDAALIQAAPELLEACERALDELDRRDGPLSGPGDLRPFLRSAIEAATGCKLAGISMDIQP